jgi:hypothetical protein
LLKAGTFISKVLAKFIHGIPVMEMLLYKSWIFGLPRPASLFLLPETCRVRAWRLALSVEGACTDA